MSWASLANNELFTFNELQDAVTNGYLAATGTAIPATNECVTKADVGTYVHISLIDSGYAALASNEELTKPVVVDSTCKELRIITIGADLSASDDGYVYYSYVDCCGVVFDDATGGTHVAHRSSVVHGSLFNTGTAYDTLYSFPTNPWILVSGVRTAVSAGSLFSAGGYTSGCFYT